MPNSSDYDDDWRKLPPHIEFFQASTEDKLRSDISHVLIGKYAAISFTVLSLILGLSSLLQVLGDAYIEADTLVQYPGDLIFQIKTVGVAFSIAMLFIALICIYLINRLNSHFQVAYSQTSTVIKEGLARSSIEKENGV